MITFGASLGWPVTRPLSSLWRVLVNDPIKFDGNGAWWTYVYCVYQTVSRYTTINDFDSTIWLWRERCSWISLDKNKQLEVLREEVQWQLQYCALPQLGFSQREVNNDRAYIIWEHSSFSFTNLHVFYTLAILAFFYHFFSLDLHKCSENFCFNFMMLQHSYM